VDLARGVVAQRQVQVAVVVAEAVDPAGHHQGFVRAAGLLVEGRHPVDGGDVVATPGDDQQGHVQLVQGRQVVDAAVDRGEVAAVQRVPQLAQLAPRHGADDGAVQLLALRAGQAARGEEEGVDEEGGAVQPGAHAGQGGGRQGGAEGRQGGARRGQLQQGIGLAEVHR